MKPFLLLLLTSASIKAQTPAALNSVAPSLPFASATTLSGTTFNNLSNTDLSALNGKVVVISFYTPWCSVCVSAINSVGTSVLAPFNATSRGVLRGKNNNGVEIVSVLLSMEPTGWDSSINTTANNSGYQIRGLDAMANRSSPRTAFSFFSGENASLTPSQLGTSSRRQIVVLNGVANSPGKKMRQILFNEGPAGSLTSAENTRMTAAINSVQADPYTTWATAQGLTSSNSAETLDVDQDGNSNIIEYFAGTYPRVSSPSTTNISTTTAGRHFVFQRNKEAAAQAYVIRTSLNLVNWDLYTPVPSAVTTQDLGTSERISVLLPSNPKLFVRLELARE
jgi:thiol-disulfide isomerase/thioredoxin